MKTNDDLQLKDANDLLLNEIKSRLISMEIDFNPNIDKKSYFVELYNNEIKVKRNRKKISSKLLEDSLKLNQASKVRQRDFLKYKLSEDDGKLPKLNNNEYAESNNNLVNINREYTDKAYNIIQKSRKNLNFLNEETMPPSSTFQNKQVSKQNLNDLISNDNLKAKKSSSNILNQIKENSNEIEGQYSNKIINIIKFSLYPRKSQFIFGQKIHPYEHVYINIIVIMMSSMCLVILIQIYSQNDLLDSIKEIAKKMVPSLDNPNFNKLCVAMCFLFLISYSINCHLINNNIANEIYNDILLILQEIKREKIENYLSELKIINLFSAKYDLHSLMFEQEILPKIKSLAYKEKKIKVFQFNDQHIWKLK